MSDTHPPVDGQQILETLAALPISTWNYKKDPPSVRHLGPMAQDFAAAFGLGDSDTTINMVDANGVVMVADPGALPAGQGAGGGGRRPARVLTRS